MIGHCPVSSYGWMARRLLCGFDHRIGLLSVLSFCPKQECYGTCKRWTFPHGGGGPILGFELQSSVSTQVLLAGELLVMLLGFAGIYFPHAWQKYMLPKLQKPPQCGAWSAMHKGLALEWNTTCSWVSCAATQSAIPLLCTFTSFPSAKALWGIKFTFVTVPGIWSSAHTTEFDIPVVHGKGQMLCLAMLMLAQHLLMLRSAWTLPF